MNRNISDKIRFTRFLVSLVILFPVLLFSAKKVPQIITPVPALDLTNIFQNQLVSDTNNDSFPDDITARFLIDNRTTAVDVEAAAAIAARLGFESSAMNPSLCVSTREEAKKKKIEWLITFSTIKNKTYKKGKNNRPGSKEDCGIKVYREKGINIIEIFGATPRARKYAAVNFFSRFPYTWDITGRETGELWNHVKEHIYSQLPESYREKAQVALTAVHYLCPEPLHKAARQRRLQRTGLSGTVRKEGEVEQADVELRIPSDTKDAAKVFKNLISAHKRGEGTNFLNYAGVKQVALHIFTIGITDAGEAVTIPRTAVPQRFLNPSTDPFFFRKKVTIKDSFSDIAGFYGTRGIYKDSDSDGFADRLASRIIYDGVLPYKAVNLAARIGLEDCTISLPFVIPADDLDMKSIKNLERPILIGSDNRFSDYLFKIGKAKRPQLQPGQGFIQFCPGFNTGGAYIISGSTIDGENAALQFAAAALPFISPLYTQPGAPEWQGLGREIELFFTRKNDAGTAAYGILQVDRQKKTFSAPDLQVAKIELYTKRQVQNLDSFISKRIQAYLTNNKLSVKTGGRLEAAKGFFDTYSPQWEVDDFREIFTQKVLPELRILSKRQPMQDAPILFIDLRLSESLEVLGQQKSWIEDMAEKAGFKKEDVKIRTITAYKQGFHWIKDAVIPRIKRTAAPAAAIQIRFSPFPVDFEETRKYRPESVRWLQELYPIDEILAKELGIPLKEIHFIKDENLSETIYELTVLGREGEKLFKENFAPFTTEIPFQSKFKKWGNVLVCSGGIRVKWGSRDIFFSTIDTDPLRLWKHYQGKILPQLTEMVEKQAGGPLKLEDQPFFDKLQIKVWMSEPDYRLGLDEELVSSLESFHEDLYFNTLDYFQGLVKKDPEMDVDNPLMAQRWAAPGNIVPIIHPSRTGQGPLMETAVTGLESLSTRVEMKFHYLEEKKPVTISKKISPLKKLKAPRLTCIVVAQNLQVKEAVYTQEFSNEEELSDAVDMLRILRELQQENILPETFSYPGLSTIRFVLTAPQGLQSQFVLNKRSRRPRGAGSRRRHFVPSRRSTTSDGKKIVFSAALTPCPRGGPAGGKELFKKHLDQALSKVMSPQETLDLAQGLGSFPEINHYIGGYSYQGRPVPVLEIGLKPGGKLVSRRKITTYKPTIFLLGRQHANEVSSTNYGFNIAYLLVTDPAYRKYLEQLNIVIEPMENPDGSALAVKLQELTPHHMLHAGRYSALGTDIGYHVDKPDTLITEAKVRKKLYDRWQPDIFLNNHGYPSHEWVQQFSNYTPYLFRAYWVPRGWYYFHRGLNTIAAPLHKKAGERIVKIISEKMKNDTEVFETNRRIYDRYRRWAERWQPHLHYLELYDGTNIYKKRRSSTAARLSRRREITVLEAIPEAMDETARDEWLQLAIRQGTLFVTSFFDLAIESVKPIERIEEESGAVVHLQIVRHRPIRVNNE